MYVIGNVMGHSGSRGVGASLLYLVALFPVVFLIVSGDDRRAIESMVQCSRPKNKKLVEELNSTVVINYNLSMRLVKGQEIIYRKSDGGHLASSLNKYNVPGNHIYLKVHDHTTATITMTNVVCNDFDSYSLVLHDKGIFQCQLLQVCLDVHTTTSCERVTDKCIHETTERNQVSFSSDNPTTSNPNANERSQTLQSGSIAVFSLTILTCAGVGFCRIHYRKLRSETTKRTFQTCPGKETKDEYGKNISIVDKGAGSTAITRKAYDSIYVDRGESVCDGKLQIDPKISEPMYYIVDKGGSNYDTVKQNSLDTRVHDVCNPISDAATRATSECCTESNIIGINVHVVTNLTTCTLPRPNQAVSKVDHSGSISLSSTRHRSLEDIRGFGIPHPYRSEHHHLTYENGGSIDKFQRQTVSAEHIGHFERDIVINGPTGSSGEAYLESETIDRARSTDRPSELTLQRSPSSSSSKPPASMDAICREKTFDCSMASPYDSLHRDRLEMWKLI